MSDADRLRWDARHHDRVPRTGPSPWLRRCATRFAPRSRIVDLAAGLGEDVSWLLDEGHDARAVDVSPVAAARATARDPRIHYTVADLDTWRAEAATLDVVVVQHYLDRTLWPRIREGLAPGGLLVTEVLTEGTPFGRRFQAKRGELLRAWLDWHVLAYEEVRTDERVLSRLFVERPA